MVERVLTQLENRWGKHRGIRNLITAIVAAMAAVYVSDLVLGQTMGFYISSRLTFNKAAILRGEIWRIITFVIVPQQAGILSFMLQLAFTYFIGNMLQNRWGTLRFNLFYLCGTVCSAIAGLVTGYATSYYVNLSLLLAVAILYPMMQVSLYGFFTIRMKWLALLELVLLLPGVVNGTWPERIAIIISMLNIVLFFGDRFIYQAREAKRRHEWKKNWRTGNWR